MDILVLGGGFGGLAAATELRRLLPDATIRVVDRNDAFFMGFAKLWELGDVRALAEGTRPLANLASHGIDHVRAAITGIDPERRRVATDAGELSADAVVVALGGGVNTEHRRLLAVPHAHDLYDPQALPAMKRALDELADGRVVVSILGGPFRCPPAPYEAAMIARERVVAAGHGDGVEVVLTTPQPMTLPAAGVDASAFLAGHLADHDVALREQHVVLGVEGQSITFADDAIHADVWLGVPASAPLEVLAPLAGASGWIEPDRHSFATHAEGIWAIGDCTHVPTVLGALPKAGVFAANEGLVAAANAAAFLGVGEGATFDGHGACYLELPGRQVAFVEGNFYADPVDVELTPPTRARFEAKLAWERDRLDAWLPTA